MSIKDKWTACDPGDYTDYNGNSIVVLGEEDTRRIAVVMGSDDYAKEAARLIAAAPEMLEALIEATACGMVPISSVKDGGASTHSRQVRCADMIRAAIAKATGGAA